MIGGEDRLLVSDFINEAGETSLSRVWTPPPLSLTMSPVACVDVDVFEPGAVSVRFPAAYL